MIYHNISPTYPRYTHSNIDDQSVRIMQLENLTGLKNLYRAFTYPEHQSEVELIVNYLNREYNFSLGSENILGFILDVIKIPITLLTSINANYNEFFDNMTVYESLTVILTKLITVPNITSQNGFPQVFNYSLSQGNTIQTWKGKKWYPYRGSTSNIRFDNLLTNIINSIGLDNIQLVYHDTSWASAISIMKKVKITSRGTATDFGLRNFYVSDSFQSACIWSFRNEQSAVVIFAIPHGYIENLRNHLKFTNSKEWKQFVWKMRNPPTADEDNEEEYEEFVNNVDSHDLISGPIMSNVEASIPDVVQCTKYGQYIPYQYSFKDSTINDLNNMYAITLFFC